MVSEWDAGGKIDDGVICRIVGQITLSEKELRDYGLTGQPCDRSLTGRSP